MGYVGRLCVISTMYIVGILGQMKYTPKMKLDQFRVFLGGNSFKLDFSSFTVNSLFHGSILKCFVRFFFFYLVI